MNRNTRTLLYAGLGVAVVNVAVAYFTSGARTGRAPGQNKLLDLNDSLTKFNPLALLFLKGGAPLNNPSSVTAPIPALSAPVVTDTAGGTTTYFG